MNVSVPNKNKSHVQSFCRSVVLGAKPVYVVHQPLPGKPLKECFSIVPQHIVTNGGKQKFGWAILEIPRIWIEAEFHVVWEREDGTLIDLTPREIPIQKILFLPDAKRQYEGVQVQSIIRAISKKPIVKEYISLSGDYYRAMNEGELANIPSGRVECPKAIEIENRMKELILIIYREHFNQ